MSSWVHGHLLPALLAAHLLGDFLLQPDGMVAGKKRLPVLGLHALVHGVLVYVLVGWWGEYRLPLAIAVLHGAVDFTKARVRDPKAATFFVDQIAHGAILAALALIWRPIAEPAGFWTGCAWCDRALIIVSGGIICIRASAIAIGFWVAPYLGELEAHRARTPSARFDIRGLTTGGRIIGQWERTLIFLFIGAGQPAAVGFLVAAKSIFRFGELKDRENRMEAEYITIGTLMSFGVACAVSFLTFWVAGRW